MIPEMVHKIEGDEHIFNAVGRLIFKTLIPIYHRYLVYIGQAYRFSFCTQAWGDDENLTTRLLALMSLSLTLINAR